MPLYYFHIRRENDLEADPEGRTFDSLEAARDKQQIAYGNGLPRSCERPYRQTSSGLRSLTAEVLTVVTIDDAVLKPLSRTDRKIP
ncbi:hypothetical protein [Pararhizobium sp. BT-229]|uniref:DUF6894 family protein n=1 Tax=Pararhizobium sp. BT-229 TaxID=2986923 RepID=UPI00355883E3